VIAPWPNASRTRCGQQLNDQYFCQQLLPDYMTEHGVDWDITYDDRGHFIEPHTAHSIGLGTISVRNYLAENGSPKLEEPGFAPGSVDTHGPNACFGFLPVATISWTFARRTTDNPTDR